MLRYPRALLALLALAMASGAAAQAIYKTIGPDGKPVYSDQPPANPSIKYTVIGSPATQPAQPGQPGQAGQPSNADPDLQKAVVGVMETSDLVRQYSETCTRDVPASAPRFATALTNWKKRNGAVVRNQERVLQDAFNAGERAVMESNMKSRNARTMDIYVAATPAAKSKWCDESLAEISNGSLDVYGKPELAQPLLKYRKPAPE